MQVASRRVRASLVAPLLTPTQSLAERLSGVRRNLVMPRQTADFDAVDILQHEESEAGRGTSSSGKTVT